MALILVLNFGSTSSKMAIYQDKELLKKEDVSYTAEEMNACPTILSQLPMRRETVQHFIQRSGFEPEDFDAIASRSGVLPPVHAGAYRIDENLVGYLKRIVHAQHPANLCPVVADYYQQEYGVPAYIYDSETTDELQDLARVTGIPIIERRSKCHVLNSKAVARKTAEKFGKKYEDLNIIVASMGGGITLSAHQKGKMVEIVNDDEGPFSPERSGGSISLALVVQNCYSGQYSQSEMMSMIRRKGGMYAYLGTTSGIEAEQRIRNGDREAELIYRAMAYQVAQGIGKLAAALSGNVDYIVLTGGLAHSQYFTRTISEYVQFIAPIEIIPGEREMEALAYGVLRVLQGEEEVHTLPYYAQEVM